MADQDPAYADASDALWAAEKALELAASEQGLSEATAKPSGTFMRGMHVLAVEVASSGGELSQAASVAINNIFWLTKKCPDPWSERDSIVFNPMLTKQSLNQTITCAQALGASALPGQLNPEKNMVCRAATATFQAVLAADPGNSSGATRAAEIVAAIKRTLERDVGLAIFGSRGHGAFAPAKPHTPATDQRHAKNEQADRPSTAGVQCPARLHDGETCVAVTTATLFQESNVVRSIRYGGLSGRARIARGISYRAGSYNVERTRAPRVERIADGTLCVTDQRLIFLSDVKNLDLPLAKLLSCATEPNTAEVTRSNSGRLLFEYLDPEAVIAFEQVTNTSPNRRLAIEAEPPPSRAYQVGRSIGHALKFAALIGLFLLVLLMRILI